MITVEFLFGVVMAWIILNLLTAAVTSSANDGVVAGVFALFLGLFIVALVVGAGFVTQAVL